MNGSLNVDSSALNSVGNQFSSIANDVRGIFTQMERAIDQVTANDSWRGEASQAFLDKFLSIKPRLETHLQQLESLGPAVNKTAENYAAAEAENVGMIQG